MQSTVEAVGEVEDGYVHLSVILMRAVWRSSASSHLLHLCHSPKTLFMHACKFGLKLNKLHVSNIRF